MRSPASAEQRTLPAVLVEPVRLVVAHHVLTAAAYDDREGD
jgi:hypothetical protein